MEMENRSERSTISPLTSSASYYPSRRPGRNPKVGSLNTCNVMVRLCRAPAKKDLSQARWRLEFEIETLGRDISATLPLVRAEADSPQRRRSMAFRQRSIGTTRASAASSDCRTRSTSPIDHLRAAFKIVGHATRNRTQSAARRRRGGVSVSVPDEVAELISDDIPLVRYDESQHSIWRGELGTNGKLTLSWPIRLDLEVGETERQVTQVSLLNVTPSGITLDLKLVNARTTTLNGPLRFK